MKRLVSISIVAILLVLSICLNVNALGVNPDEDNDIQVVKCTAYTSSNPNARCASGCKPRYGIFAGADWMFYDTKDGATWSVYVWTIGDDGKADEFLGIYELLDRGGTDAIHEGYVIDIYEENLDDCHAFMEKTRGKVLVKYVRSYG